MSETLPRRICAVAFALLVLSSLIPPTLAAAKEKPKKGAAAEAAGNEEKDILSAGTFTGLAFRGIGPALTSGRISDLAVDTAHPGTVYAAAASGGVWKTTNWGTTWKPIFDDQGSYSIGCVTLDPSDPLTVWVGSGENNSQRSVGYGDGVYKSVDGGTRWEKVGLEDSQHIGKIVVDPRDSKTVWVAAQGPLWNAGSDRGLYKTTDGGKTWTKSLEISEHTGVTDVVLDPRDPDVLYAAAYQRRRRVWTLIDGGPESAIYKSSDGGASWKKLTNGLPKEDMGRIGLAVSPVDPDVVYAIIEAAGEAGGFYRSTDAGSNWEKRADYVSSSPQYYQEIVADPKVVDRVYSLDTWMMVTEDGGKTWQRMPNNARHVDDHALWIDPTNTDHLLVGCDGGIYESFDRGASWDFVANLPVTQFYKLAVDNDLPFYNVYGGTQDNFTLGGPSRTTSDNGITNREWFVVVGGDGFQPQVDPENPDIVYGQSQYGNLVRLDRASGEITDIQPQPAPGEDPLRFNWDSPLLISPHSPTRLYFASQRIFKSDDRGDSWKPISPDLSRQLDRNKLEVMGRVWSVDAVAKNASTSFYGNVVALDESPRVEGLLYAGTDDGLIQVSEDGGDGWRVIDSFPGVPERSYVNDLAASLHDPDTVYAAFNNHKSGDFKPYLLKSTDRGRSWVSIAGDLPERGSVYTVVQDGAEPGLLFTGTEFGAFFTLDGGSHWVRLQGGIPTVAVRDLAIQRRENDLVAATFGRGFYILDDYTPLRGLTREKLEQEALLFPVEDAWMYMLSHPLGIRGKAFLGDSFFIAPNPPFGAMVTYYLKQEIQSLEKARQEQEKLLEEKHEEVFYPSWDELRREDREEAPAMLITVRDEDGQVVRRLTGPVGAGFQRVAWDLRYPPTNPTRLEPPPPNPFFEPPQGPQVAPGTYSVSLAKRVDGEVTELAGPVSFEARPLGLATLAAADREAALAFQKKVGRLQRAVLGAARAVDDAQGHLELIKKALDDTPGADLDLASEARSIEDRLQDLRDQLEGDGVIASRNEPIPPSIVRRVRRIVEGSWTSSSAPTATQQDSYEAAAQAFAEVLPRLTTLLEEDLADLERRMEAAGAPWTPGRVPRWQP